MLFRANLRFFPTLSFVHRSRVFFYSHLNYIFVNLAHNVMLHWITEGKLIAKIADFDFLSATNERAIKLRGTGGYVSHEV